MSDTTPLSIQTHHIEEPPVVGPSDWCRVFVDAAAATARATGKHVAEMDDVAVLLTGQPDVAENGTWLVRADGSHRRPERQAVTAPNVHWHHLFPPLDIENHERENRDLMIRSNWIPRPDQDEPDVVSALSAAGVVVVRDDGDRLKITLPDGWRAEADLFNHRRWFLTDRHGVRRFGCGWTENVYTPGRGSTYVVKNEAVVRHWTGPNDQIYWEKRVYRLTLSCARCASTERRRVDFTADVFERQRHHAEEFARRAEARFLAEHKCEARTAAPQERLGGALVPAVLDPSAPLDLAVVVHRR